MMGRKVDGEESRRGGGKEKKKKKVKLSELVIFDINSPASRILT